MTDDAGADAAGPNRRRRRRDLESRAHDARAHLEAQARATRAQLEALDERIEARAGRNLPRAIVIGLVLGFALLFSLIFVKDLFILFATALVGFTVFELASALRFAGRDVPRLPSVVTGMALIPVAFYFGAPGLWVGFLGAVVVVTLWRIVEIALARGSRPSVEDARRDLGAGVFILAYVPLLGAFAALLTSRPGGEWWTLAFLIIVIAVDTGAYASGLAWGRHPMAPRISPKKTWEGFLGSVTTAIVAGIVLAEFMIGISAWSGILLGLVLVLTATVGDLIESLIKRDLGIKDISTWLPGHGGFLDRVDSALPSSVVAYAMHLLLA